jgi:ketosteroid isomerase-like protein
MATLPGRRIREFVAASAIAIAAACGAQPEPQQTEQIDLAARRDEVRARETAFARSMADRDLAAFTSFISPEAVFVGVGGTTHGPQEISAAWKRFFEAPDAPFSWRPETVEVLPSGTLGLSTGPVFDPKGERIGTYNSTWRRDADGVWRIIFDNGCP